LLKPEAKNATPSITKTSPIFNKIRFGWLINPTMLALLGAIGLALIYGRVAVANLGVGVVGGDADGYENLWNDFWTKTALLKGHNPYFTDYMYYPFGISLRYHTLHPLTALLAIPLWPVIGAVATTNLIFLISLVLTTFCGYLLINDFVQSPLASFAGAAIFTYANDQVLGFFGAGQTEKLSAEWLPLYLFFMFRLVFRPSQWRLYGLLSILALFLLTFTDWQYTIYAVLTTALFFGFSLFTRRSWREKGLIFLKLAGVGGSWGGIIIFPLVLPMVDEANKNPWLSVSEQSLYHSLDLLGYLQPALTNPGYLPIALMLLGLVVALRNRENREMALFWAICGLFAMLFTLGPQLIIGGNVTDLPMPYALFYKIPGLSAGRDPGRFYTLFLLAFGLLLACGLKFLLERNFFMPVLSKIKLNWQAPLRLGIVAGILVLSLSAFMIQTGKVEIDPLNTPKFFEEIAQDSEQYALLELPLFTEKGRGENVYQAYQIIHNKLRFGGRYARDHKLANPNNFSKRETYYRDFYWQGSNRQDYFRPPKDFITPPDLQKVGLPLLNYWKVRYIILWKEAMPEKGRLEAQRSLVQAALGKNATPVYQDERMEAYKVPVGQSYPDKVVLDVGNGWYDSQTDGKGQYRWADSGADTPSELYLTNLTQESVRISLNADLFSFVAEGTKQPRTITVAINGYTAARYDFPEFGDEKKIELEISLPPGFNILSFSSPEAAQPASKDLNQDARKLTFGARAISFTIKG
jgi:hypothetical protein